MESRYPAFPSNYNPMNIFQFFESLTLSACSQYKYAINKAEKKVHFLNKMK